jgi:hypothetical protein
MFSHCSRQNKGAGMSLYEIVIATDFSLTSQHLKSRLVEKGYEVGIMLKYRDFFKNEPY